MASLSTSLHIAVQGLNAATGGLQITNNNIANANTKGYSRQVAVTSETLDARLGVYNLGNGVEFSGYKSVRAELLLTRIRQETEAQTGANAQLSSMQTIEASFTSSSTSGDIGTKINALFTSISDLSSNPSSSPLRESVLTAAQNLGTAFYSASRALTTQQESLNAQVDTDVTQINSLCEQIAALNPQISNLQRTNGGDAGTLQDKQEQLILQLSELTNVSVAQSDEGVTISTGGGTPLVVGLNSYDLKTAISANGKTHVIDANGNDLTSSLTTGDLGGTLVTRDQSIAKLQNQLDQLAFDLGTAFNAAQAKGYDADGNAGAALFNLPTTASGAAAAMTVALNEPDQIAASSDGSSGSNGNLANFTAIQSAKLASGRTPTDAYASIVYQVGNLTSSAQNECDASTATLNQLNDQINSISGVSIDEEAANLVQYQQAYSAAAHVISTVQTLFTELMNVLN